MYQNGQNVVWIKNRLAYLKFSAIFEFLGQFTISYTKKDAYIVFQKDVFNFEIEHITS